MRALVGHQLEPVRHSDEFGERTGSHLSHQMAAMHLHGRFSDADIASDLLVQTSPRNLNQDLALPRNKRVKTLLQADHDLLVFPPHAIARKANFNGVEQILIAERLRQELNSPALHRTYRHRDVAVTSDEDHWELSIRGAQ